MIVIKVGGSLAESNTLRDCLDRIGQKYCGKQLVIVPGGGAFADQVRLAQLQFQFDDQTAHAMAILAMQQMALLFKGLKPEFIVAHTLAAIRAQSTPETMIIWSPDTDELNNAGIEASWDITSDSLSAWLAKKLLASELILVKSAIIEPDLNLQQLAEKNIIDKAFAELVADAEFKLHIINQAMVSSDLLKHTVGI